RGEVVVPEDRQPFGERVGAEEHPKDPPGLEPAGVVGADRRVGEEFGGGVEFAWHTGESRLAGEKAVDTRLRAVLEVALQFVPGGGEPGPAVQVDDAAKVPRALLIGRVGRPRFGSRGHRDGSTIILANGGVYSRRLTGSRR